MYYAAKNTPALRLTIVALACQLVGAGVSVAQA